MLTVLYNTLVAPPEVITSALDALHLIHTPGPHPHTQRLDVPKELFTRMPIFTSGMVYLLNPSSLLPVIALDPQPQDQVLDLAAAPGGKTIHCAIRMGNTGEIVANDLSFSRVARMKRILAIYGITSARTTTIPGQRLWMKYPDYFDRVLLDAPCSMQGTDTPSTDSPAKMARLQRWLLRAAISACKPGGVVVYSTCTTSVEENEEVIDWILHKDEGKVSVEPFVIPPPPVIPGEVEGSHRLAPTLVPPLLTAANSAPLHPSITHCMRVERSGEYEGFFVAKLRRAG